MANKLSYDNSPDNVYDIKTIADGGSDDGQAMGVPALY
jgi:hypothetical protein